MKLVRRRDHFALRGQFRVLSSAPWHGGLYRAETIANVRVPLDFREPVSRFFARFERRTGYRRLVGLLTAVDVRTTVVRRDRFATVAATAGTGNSSRVGTINIIAVLTGNPTDTAMVEAVKVVTEAKVASLVGLDIRAHGRRATGTSTDAVVIASAERGVAYDYCGPATPRGAALGAAVAGAVREALASAYALTEGRPIVRRLAERGWSLQELAVRGKGAEFEDREGWETAFALDDAVTEGRLPAPAASYARRRWELGAPEGRRPGPRSRRPSRSRSR